MHLPQLTVYRHNRRTRTLITLVGEIDLESAPLVRASLEWCLRDGIRTIDVDLALVTFCGFLLLGSQFAPRPPSVGDAPAGPLPAPSHRSVPLAPILSGDVR
jgi:hypothetical protein